MYLDLFHWALYTLICINIHHMHILLEALNIMSKRRRLPTQAYGSHIPEYWMSIPLDNCFSEMQLLNATCNSPSIRNNINYICTFRSLYCKNAQLPISSQCMGDKKRRTMRGPFLPTNRLNKCKRNKDRGKKKALKFYATPHTKPTSFYFDLASKRINGKKWLRVQHQPESSLNINPEKEKYYKEMKSSSKTILKHNNAHTSKCCPCQAKHTTAPHSRQNENVCALELKSDHEFTNKIKITMKI